MILITKTASGVTRLVEIDHAVHGEGTDIIHARWKGDCVSKEYRLTKKGYTSVTVLTDNGEELLSLIYPRS